MNLFNNRPISRRSFLNDCGKMTGIGAISSILSLKLANTVLAARPAGSISDYKGLVCVFLFGGSDSYNTLAPGIGGYADYLRTRGSIGLQRNTMHRITSGSADYHLNPSLDGVASLYNSGDLSFISNIGTLVEPTSLAQYNNRSVGLPYGLFSHIHQLTQWQTSISHEANGPLAGTGWLGRTLDILHNGANNNAVASVNLAPYGANTAQIGQTIAPFLTDGGVDALDLYGTDTVVKEAMDATLEAQYTSVLQAHHNYIRKDAIEQSEHLADIESNTEITTVFPETQLGRQLLQVAKFIKAQGPSGINANRQTFFVGQGGYDTHGQGAEVHTRLTGDLNDALVAFNTALKEIGYHDKVVTYTASDFGRTFVPNSIGTDHGWGGNQMVMGGPVNGGRVFGSYPDIALGTSTDIGRGRQIPTTSVDALNASLAYWFGVNNDSEMESIIPNIRNFWSAGSNRVPITGLF